MTQYSYVAGNKVIYKPEGRVYDFGYYSQSPGLCAIYIEGKRNGQDSFAVKLSAIRLATTREEETAPRGDYS